MQIVGATAVITGGASGLGEGTALRLHNHGAQVVLADVNEERGQALVAQLGERAAFVKTDVTDTEQVQGAMDFAVANFGRLDILVNCAGIGRFARTYGRGGPHDLDLFKKVIDINLVGTFDAVRLGAEKMAANEPNEQGERGVIVNTSSIEAFEGHIGLVAYSASKAAVAGITLTIARELGSYGIRVCSIAPGFFDTPIHLGRAQELLQHIATQAPFPKRPGTPDEYAMLAQQIVENSMLNGETIRLDGALRLTPR